MSRPFTRIVAFISILLVALIALDAAVRYVIKQCPQGNTAKVNAVMMKKVDSEITVWGASTARVHFDTPMMQEKLGVSCFNLGLDGTPFQQYSGMLEEYIDYSQNGKVLVLAIDINGLGTRGALYQGFAWMHHLGNDYVFEAIKSIDEDAAIKSRYVPLYYLTTYDRRFLGRCLKWVYVGPDIEPELGARGFHANDVKWQTNQHGRYQKNFNVAIDQEVIRKMRRVIRSAVERNMRVVVVVPPCYQGVREMITNLALFRQAIDSFRDENVSVLNYLDNKICSERDYFSNYTHLNSKGASRFTSIFIKDIREFASTSYAQARK